MSNSDRSAQDSGGGGGSGALDHQLSSSDSDNVFYKGWILTNQEGLSTSGHQMPYQSNGHSHMSQAQIDSIKWAPKFAVLNKQTRSMLLYDYEPTTDYIKENFNAIASTLSSARSQSSRSHQQSSNIPNAPSNHSSSSSYSSESTISSLEQPKQLKLSNGPDVAYRLDGSIRKELFINYWRNRITKFELSLGDPTNAITTIPDEDRFVNSYHFGKRGSEASTLSSEQSHHQDSELGDKSSFHDSNSSQHNTFRLAGLFFPKKSEKVKHASLKRAKSGAQLERKPIKHTMSSAPSAAQTPDPSTKSIGHTLASAVSAATSDLETRNRLPSPMIRPSRSHESLNSPVNNMKQDAIEQSFATKLKYHPHQAANGFMHDDDLMDSLIRLNLANGATAVKVNNKSSQPPNNTQQSLSQQETNSKKLDLAQRILNSKRRSINHIQAQNLAIGSSSQATNSFINRVQAQSIHPSLFNEEYCFEIDSLINHVNILNVRDASDDQLPHIDVKQFATSADEDEDDDDDDEDIDSAFNEVKSRQASNHDEDSIIDSSSSVSGTRHKPVGRLFSASSNTSAGGQKLLKYQVTEETLSQRLFMCRGPEEREKWLQCIKTVYRPNQDSKRRQENSLQVCILEAKGLAIGNSSGSGNKSNKKYYCEVNLNSTLHSRTSLKEKKDILFWGENFDFSDVTCDLLRVDFFQLGGSEATQKMRKSKKEKDRELTTSRGGGDTSLKESHSSSYSLSQLISFQTLLGHVIIPVNTVDSNQPTEKWYKLETVSDSVVDDTKSISSQQSASTAASSSTAGNLTSNFSKDSISIRIKAKYQSVDILPLEYYKSLVDYIKDNYLTLTLTLEPQLSVRLKDDLANSLVRISHKLHIQIRFLTDLIMAEILQLEDSSLTFRGNSLATKSIESYMKLVGESYLKNTLSDCVRYIIDSGADLEIDPSKVGNNGGGTLQANQDELIQILHVVCGRVFNSYANFPIHLKLVFASLRDECKKNGKTDEMCDMLISACVFLRFICPAILSPNLFNLTQEYPHEKAARKLTLTAKTLQTIANFSKFGGKESYMSFDKMNSFVDEHTLLMRDFLRNISTLESDEIETFMSTTTTTPSTSSSQTPAHHKSIKFAPPASLPLHSSPSNSHPPTRHNKQTSSILVNHEINYESDPVDLGKQLSILHTLLVSIMNSIESCVDQTPATSSKKSATSCKFDPVLVEILNELSVALKQKQSDLKSLSSSEQSASGTNKLYSYENRLHKAIMTKNTSSVPTTPTTPPPPLSIDNLTVSSDTGVDIKSSDSVNRIGSSVSSSGSSKSSSQIALNEAGAVGLTNPKLYHQKKLEDEISVLKQKLRDTELSLKKEQTEKYLIEFKLKQQQLENDQQMRNIINRLIKVEEELRKEQTEMHKLLKAKQDLIDIQKKRIEYLQSRCSGPTNLTGSTNNLTSSNTESSAQSLLFSQLKINHEPSSTSSSSSTSSTASQSIPAKSQPHHHHPKLRQAKAASSSNKSQSSSLNDFSVLNNNVTVSNTNNKPSVPSATVALVDRSQLIAASPSSSASSIHQFCSPYIGSSSSNNSNVGQSSTFINLSSSLTPSSLSNNLASASNPGSANYLRASEL